MTHKCKHCGVIYTNQSNTIKVDPKSVPVSVCSDCATYDYPIWNKRIEQVRSWLTDPKKTKKDGDVKSKKAPVR